MLKKIVLWFLVIGWATMIFFLSAQTDRESNRISVPMSETLLQTKTITRDMPDYRQEIVEKAMHTFVRKMAHYSLYAILGFLIMTLSIAYRRSAEVSFIIALLACLLYAACDELHQLLVPGRSGEVQDVLLDGAGSTMGLLIYWLCSGLRTKKKLKNVV